MYCLADGHVLLVIVLFWALGVLRTSELGLGKWSFFLTTFSFIATFLGSLHYRRKKTVRRKKHLKINL